jgi:hypothetical protein
MTARSRLGPLCPLAAIARNTFAEVVRQPAFAIVVVATLASYACAPSLALFSLGHEPKLLEDFGLSTLILAGFVLACLAAGNAVRRELDEHTALALFAKPVSREGFLAAKLLGVSMALVLAHALFTLALLLAARAGGGGDHQHHVSAHGAFAPADGPAVAGGLGGFLATLAAAVLLSVLRRRSFCGSLVVLSLPGLSAGALLAAVFAPGWRWAGFAAGFDPQLVGGAVLALFAVIVLASFAVCAAVWLGRGGTFVATLLFFLGGLSSQALDPSVRGAFGWLADFQVFWVGDLVYSGEAEVTASYTARAALYAAGWILTFLSVGAVGVGRKGL